VCWSADNSEETAGIRYATEDIDEDENCAGSPAGTPSASVNSRPHMTMMAYLRSTRGLPHGAAPCHPDSDPGSVSGNRTNTSRTRVKSALASSGSVILRRSTLLARHCFGRGQRVGYRCRPDPALGLSGQHHEKKV